MAFQFPVATGRKKPVQVFECPQETWKLRQPSARKVRSICVPYGSNPAPLTHESQPKAAEGEALSLKEEIRKEFDETFASVKEFAASNLKGREKKAYDAKRIEALGGKAAANRKVPYHIMMGIKKAAAKREERDRAVSKEADVVTGKRKKVAGGFKPTEKKRKKIDFGIQATKGRFKRGVLDVSKL